MPNSTIFRCIQSPVFRVFKVDKDTCCAELELLQPLTRDCLAPIITSENGICRFFPNSLIERFIRTGICLTINLEECFCGVECLEAVHAQQAIPQIPDVCTNPVITINVPSTITCTGVITGTVTCNGKLVENSIVSLEATPNIIIFDQNPVFTNSNGEYSVIVTVPPNTPPTQVVITATTTVNGLTISANGLTTVSCNNNGDECNGCGIHVGTQVTDTTVTVDTPEGEQTFTGTLNINALSCGESCNPANDNFTIQFRGTGEDNGITINFIQGRRQQVSCIPGQSMTLTGLVRVTGNNPFPNNQIFNVTIALTNANQMQGSWVITANDNSGNLFQTSFNGTVNPNVIQMCP